MNKNKLKFMDLEGTELTFHIDNKCRTVSIGITDCVGRNTNSILISFHDLKEILETIFTKTNGVISI